ncbi:MAG: sugar phosphate isomerase/epimerase [Ruminococcaceae bacterium]|nr:sugar phosphate isomerase/epimerase [Oscillospiraceae bacterium]
MAIEYGLQLFSVRDVTDKDLEGTLKAVAEMGYNYVEYAGFFGHSAEQVKEWQDKYGLKCSGTHSGWVELLPENIEATIAYHKTIGNPNYIIPGADLSTLDKIIDFCAVMNKAQIRLAEEGISLGYHNHSHEFVVMPWGSTIHSELEKRGTFDFEIDTFWAFNAGIDPVETLKRLSGRVRVIHLKDGFKGGQGKSLGQGEAPVLKVREYAIKNDIRMVVESEGLDPTGLEEVKRCIDFLKAQE